jgi:hypothetical protein
MFLVNTEFPDYKTFLETKKLYEEQSKTILVVSECRKLKGPEDFSKKFVYDRVIFVCKAGFERPSQSKGYRTSSTLKKNCPVKVASVYSIVDYNTKTISS